MMGRPGGLRVRLLLGTAATLLAALLAVDATAYVALSRFLESRIEKNIDLVLERASRQVAALDGEPVTTADVDRILPPDVYVALYEDVELILERRPGTGDPGTPPPGTPPVDARVRALTLDEGPLLVRVGGRVAAVDRVVVALPRAEDRRTLQRFLRVQVVSGLLILVLALLSAATVLRAGLAPLRELADTARTIGRGERRQVRVDNPGTEVGEVAHALDQALTERQRSEDRVRDFVADASHELRTPLSTVHGWADLYLNGGLDRWEDVDLAMDRIRDETARMSALVDQLLVLARLDAGALPSPTDVDLTTLCAQVVADAAAAAPEHSLAIMAPEGSEAVVVRADEASLRQVVTNLVVNATRHTPAGTQVDVLVGPVRDDVVLGSRSVGLCVRDTGPGLTEPERSRAFDRFWRHGRAGATGTGLGLAIVRDLVLAHGGRVTLEETRGGGLTARVEWPVVSAADLDVGDDPGTGPRSRPPT